MFSVSFSPFSPRPPEMPPPERGPTLEPPGSPAEPLRPVARTVPEKAAESVANAVPQAPAAVVPSTVDMRFEFNALTQAWLLAMTDTTSGEVVRKIDLKGFSRGASNGLHLTGHAIDQKV